MKTVITYQFANVPGTTTLCARHANVENGLGPVSHGAHDGVCDRCAAATSYGVSNGDGTSCRMGLSRVAAESLARQWREDGEEGVEVFRV